MVAPQALAPSDPAWPRFSARAFPPYRYVPGVTLHPRRDPNGHSFRQDEPSCGPWDPRQWRELAPWLYGVDLYNFAYWWESHEQLEALWLAAGRTTVHARFVQGLLQIAAALLNRHMGRPRVARLALEGTVRMRAAASDRRSYMGVDVTRFTTSVEDLFADRLSKPPLIRLGV